MPESKRGNGTVFPRGLRSGARAKSQGRRGQRQVGSSPDHSSIFFLFLFFKRKKEKHLVAEVMRRETYRLKDE